MNKPTPLPELDAFFQPEPTLGALVVRVRVTRRAKSGRTYHQWMTQAEAKAYRERAAATSET
jgi:hypothetical protein